MFHFFFKNCKKGVSRVNTIRPVSTLTCFELLPNQLAYTYTLTNDGGGGEVGRNGGENEGDIISVAEAKKLMRLVNVEALKMKFGAEREEVIYYKELLQAYEAMGVVKSVDEAKAFMTVLDEAGVVLIFRDKVYLHPDKGGSIAS